MTDEEKLEDYSIHTDAGLRWLIKNLISSHKIEAARRELMFRKLGV